MKLIRHIAILKLIVFAFSATAQDSSISDGDSKLARKTVKAWSVAHDKWDIDALKDLYADTLIFYTEKLPAGIALSKITGMLRPREVFKHKLISDIDLKLLSNGNIKCNFTKEVTTKGKTRSYPSYLVLQSVGDRFLICAEGDYITDKNLAFDYEEKYLTTASSKKEAVDASGNWTYILSGALGAGAIFFFFSRKKKKPFINNEPRQEKEIKKEEPTPTEKIQSEFEINKQKGDEFETYVVGKFDKNYFRSKAWRSDKAAHGHFPEANSYPDLEFEFRHNDYRASFAVECKYRSGYNGGYIDLGDFYKLNAYRKFEREKNIQVYVVLGVGGAPSDPEELFIIPLPHVTSNKIHRRKLTSEYSKSINSKFFYNTYNHVLT